MGGRRQRSVLALLVLNLNSVVSVTRLMDGVWGDSGLDRPPNSLQVYIYNLRQILEPHKRKADPYRLIVSHEPGYVLQLSPSLVDGARFEAKVSAARGLLKKGEARGAVDQYLEAESCWRGAALADLIFEPFAAAEANRLETMLLDALEERFDLQLQLGLHAGVVGELEALVNEHPFREGLRAQLMVCLYRCQRQADALRTFNEGRDALVDQLGLEPGPRLTQLQGAILNHDPILDAPNAERDPDASSRASPPGTSTERPVPIGPSSPLPRPLSSLVGRNRDVEEVVQIVRTSFVTTLVGVAGCGKSRLAYAAAAELRESFPDGVFAIDLTAVEDPREVEARICDELGISGGSEVALGAQISSALRQCRALILLDNCEHVLDATAKLAADIARLASESALLLTSREAIGISGEVVYPVRTLTVPTGSAGDADHVMTFESVQLFVDRARLVSPAFALSASNASAVAAIVTHLDGLPLAIELVAARTRTLSPEDLAARLQHRSTVLDFSHRTPTERQQTLRTTIDWSYDLLVDPERTALCELATFTGGWTLDAAEAVCTADETVDLIDRLVNKSLATAQVTATGRRFRMPEVVREYAIEKLGELHDRYRVERRLAEWCAESARIWASELVARRSAASIAAIEAERSNLLQSAAWLLDNDSPVEGLQIIELLTELWIRKGRWSEARVWLIRGLSAVHSHTAPTNNEIAGRLMAALASVYVELGDENTGQQWASEARSLFKSRGLEVEAASATCVLGRTYRAAGDLEKAEALTLEALEGFRACGNARGEAIALRDLGVLARIRGDDSQARSFLEDGLAMFRSASQPSRSPSPDQLQGRGLSEFVNQLGRAAGKDGDLTAAQGLLTEGFDLASQRGNVVGIAESLIALGSLNLQRGNAINAAMLLGAVHALCESHNTALPRVAESERLALVSAVEQLLGPESYAAALEEGAPLLPHEIVELASSA